MSNDSCSYSDIINPSAILPDIAHFAVRNLSGRGKFITSLSSDHDIKFTPYLVQSQFLQAGLTALETEKKQTENKKFS